MPIAVDVYDEECGCGEDEPDDAEQEFPQVAVRKRVADLGVSDDAGDNQQQ